MMLRHLAVIPAVTILALGVPGCDGHSAPTDGIAVVDIAPEHVASVTFTAAGKSARFVGQGSGNFVAGPGATSEFALVLSTVADRVFPVNAYRTLTGVDAAQPEYGLVATTAGPGSRPAECGARCLVEIESDSGETWMLEVGGRSFNGAGFYARLDGEPGVRLLVAQTVNDIITFATGQRFELPPTARVSGIDREIEAIGTEGGADGRAAEHHAFLRQALAADADEAAARSGKPGGNLARAATSTQDQAGGRPNRPVRTESADPGGAGR